MVRPIGEMTGIFELQSVCHYSLFVTPVCQNNGADDDVWWWRCWWCWRWMDVDVDVDEEIQSEGWLL